MTVQPPETVAADIVRMLSPDFTANGTLFEVEGRTTSDLLVS